MWGPYGHYQPGLPAPQGLTHFAEEESKAQGIFKFFNLNKVAIFGKKKKNLTDMLKHMEIRFSPISLTGLIGSTPSTCLQDALKWPNLTQLKREIWGQTK